MKPTQILSGSATAVLFASTFLTAAIADSQAEVPPVGEIGGPLRPLSPTELEQFVRGRDLFRHFFTKSEGVGLPEMNADGCAACHQDPVDGGAGALELNVSRFARDNGGQGPFEVLPGGQVASKLRPPWAVLREEYDPATADVFEQRQTPALFGLGLFDQVPDAEILLREDPNDLDGDGIRGVARRVTIGSQIEIGRLGWKAQIPTMADFVKDGMGGENGITTPDDGRGFAFPTDQDTVADPELSQAQVDDVAFFLRLLGPPIRVGSQDSQVLLGEQLFTAIGCAKCHVPVLEGTTQPVRAFTDLLLHDVMAPSFRGMEEADAPAGSYRTPFLWGVRHTAPYMHDGRAETLRAAILAHDGEALQVRTAFEQLLSENQDAVIRFLEDL